MPPKTRYTRDVVLDAAIEVTRTQGLRAVSARSVAKALEASTAPVASAFSSMQLLIEAVVERLLERLVKRIEAAEGPDPLRAAAFAFARFTADEPNFYEALFLLPHVNPPDWVEVRRSFAEGLHESVRFGGLAVQQRDALAWRVSVITHGICIEIWSKRWDATDDSALRRLVDQLVEPILDTYTREAARPTAGRATLEP